MRENIQKFVLNFIRVYLLGGLLNLFFLIYLVITDSYFRKLDFNLENFKTKIDKYLLFTFNIPLLILVVFSAFIVIKAYSKKDKLIIGFSSLLGIAGFIFIDKIIKKEIIYMESILLSLLVSLLCYIFLFFITYKLIIKMKV